MADATGRMRLFVGSFVSPENLAFYDAYVQDLVRRASGSLKPIPARSAHVTHAFLGDVTGVAARRVARLVADVAERTTAVAVRFGAPSILYARREARLVRADVVLGQRELWDLGRRIVDTLTRHAEVGRIDPPRAPHLTLARFRKGCAAADAERVAGLIATTGGDQAVGREDEITSIQLIRSELGPHGPVYDVVARFDLQPRTSRGR
jgi:2'-5' RNA ligase